MSMSGMVRFFFVALILCMIVSCSKKSEQYRESETDLCKANKIQNQFIAHWVGSEPSLVETEDVHLFIQKYQQLLKFIEPNYFIRLNQDVNYERLNRSVSAYKILYEIGVLDAWRQGYTGQEIRVAVIDSGVDLTNRNLRKNVFINSNDSTFDGIDNDDNGFVDDVHGWNFAENSPDIIDEIGHGTSIAGIITGRNMFGDSLGIAPSTKIIPIDIMSGALGNEYAAKKAIDYAILMRANIINNSWSITCSNYLSSSYENYRRDDVLFVNSAGNVPLDVVAHNVMLASLDIPNFLNVGSTDLNGAISSFSGYGRTINLWAPGEQVPVLTPFQYANSLTKASGTSVSAAIVSGSAALIWSAHPEESAREVANRLIRGSRSVEGRSFISIQQALNQ